MGEVVAVFVTIGLAVLGLYGMVWAVSRSLRRRNEVSVRHPTRPPLRWLASPEVCGRLHRRLRDAVVVLRVAIPEPRGRRRRDLSPLAALASELEMHAVALDCDLRVVARLRGQTRSVERQAVVARIDAVERSAHRLAAEGRGRTREGVESTDEALRRISEYLDARDAAWDDLSRIERDVGLGATA
jgi:hypothetical protein